MSAIYELKSQIFNQIINEANKVIQVNSKVYNLCNNNSINDNFEPKYNLPINKNLKLDLSVHSINIEHIDAKNYHYSIEFNLLLNINNEFYKNSEKDVYSVIERILRVLHAMDFYYCYKVSNHNIKTEETFIKASTESPNREVIISWITNLNLDSNWLN